MDLFCRTAAICEPLRNSVPAYGNTAGGTPENSTVARSHGGRIRCHRPGTGFAAPPGTVHAADPKPRYVFHKHNAEYDLTSVEWEKGIAAII